MQLSGILRKMLSKGETHLRHHAWHNSNNNQVVIYWTSFCPIKMGHRACQWGSDHNYIQWEFYILSSLQRISYPKEIHSVSLWQTHLLLFYSYLFLLLCHLLLQWFTGVTIYISPHVKLLFLVILDHLWLEKNWIYSRGSELSLVCWSQMHILLQTNVFLLFIATHQNNNLTMWPLQYLLMA